MIPHKNENKDKMQLKSCKNNHFHSLTILCLSVKEEEMWDGDRKEKPRDGERSDQTSQKLVQKAD